MLLNVSNNECLSRHNIPAKNYLYINLRLLSYMKSWGTDLKTLGENGDDEPTGLADPFGLAEPLASRSHIELFGC